MGAAVGDGAVARLGGEQLEPEVGARLEVASPDHDHLLLDRGPEAGPDAARLGVLQVGPERELLNMRRAAGAAHGVAIEPGAVAFGSAQPFGVADHDPAGLAGADGIDPGSVGAGRVPDQQRRVIGRAAIDLGVIGLLRLRPLADVSVDQPAVAVHGEALEHRVGGGAKAVDPLDGLAGGVEEDLVDLGDGVVAVDLDPDVEPPGHQRPAGQAGLVGNPRLERAHALGRSGVTHAGARQPAGPVVPQERRLDPGLASAEQQLLAGLSHPAVLAGHVGRLATDDVDPERITQGGDREGGVARPDDAPLGLDPQRRAAVDLDEHRPGLDPDGGPVEHRQPGRLVEQQASAAVEPQARDPRLGHHDLLPRSDPGGRRRPLTGDLDSAADRLDRRHRRVHWLGRVGATGSRERQASEQSQACPSHHRDLLVERERLLALAR